MDYKNINLEDSYERKISTRLKQLAGVKEPEGRNAFKPLKDTLTFEKQRSKYVVFNYNKGDSVFDYDIIATFPTRKAAVSFIETTKKNKLRSSDTTKLNTFKSKTMKRVAIAIKGEYWVPLCRPTSKEIAEQYRDAVCRGETFHIVTEKELSEQKHVLR